MPSLHGAWCAPFLAGFGLSESQLNPVVMEFTDSNLKLTGWSIDLFSQPHKGVTAPVEDSGMKSPDQRIMVIHPGTESVKVYVLSVKP
ncbi:hypothetical protein [Kitasatospora sp. NPDC002965]|uniref:hypothetical protein n=1 Tax=Kitasatospora sp. NPDC002965 TaxID=3154775 RepID=UPI0033B2DB8E